MLVLYTDGVTEVRGAGAEVFGHRELIEPARRRAAACPRTRSPSGSRAAVMNASEGRLRDDIAILAFGPSTADAGQSPPQEENDG